MPQHKSAEKRIRQNQRRRLINVQRRSKLKTAIKNVKNAPDQKTATTELRNTISILDRMAFKKIIHRNKAANIKSKLTRFVNTM